MSEKILVTSYPNPDLDGCACAFAYAEFLQKQGKDAIAGYYLRPYHEVEYVFNRFDIKMPLDISNLKEYFDNIVLVDHSWKSELFEVLDHKKVIEIIDHHHFSDSSVFVNAKKIQNDKIGAAATIVAERYKSTEILMSKESAILLYSAILSNTINFNSNTTTERDVKMAAWLKQLSGLNDNYVKELFKAKSEIDKSLPDLIESDYTQSEFYGINMGIGQLEIADISDFVRNNYGELKKIMENLYKRDKLNFLFINFIDILKGYNIMITYNSYTEDILKNIYHITFKDNIGETNKVIMRKEIFSKLKDYLIKKMDEHVVLIDENNQVLGIAPKAEVHTGQTPLHRAFSLFIFNSQGELLLQQRSHKKKTWPLIWSNSCCGHPSLNEENEAAVVRRTDQELGIKLDKVYEVLPNYRYRAELDGVVENEICPVFVAFVDIEPRLNDDEIEAIDWIDWTEFLNKIKSKPGTYSPWSEEEAQLLANSKKLINLLAENC